MTPIELTEFLKKRCLFRNAYWKYEKLNLKDYSSLAIVWDISLRFLQDYLKSINNPEGYYYYFTGDLLDFNYDEEVFSMALFVFFENSSDALKFKLGKKFPEQLFLYPIELN